MRILAVRALGAERSKSFVRMHENTCRGRLLFREHLVLDDRRKELNRSQAAAFEFTLAELVAAIPQTCCLLPERS